MKMWLTMLALVIGLAVPAFAQGGDSSQQQQSGQAQQNSSQSGSAQKSGTSTTTTQTNPTQVTRTVERTTGVDPIWLVVGGVALLAIVLIAILSMRGRRGSDTAVVREHTTVVKE